MAEPSQSPWYCLACGAENTSTAGRCRTCLQSPEPTPQQQRAGLAFLLNELEGLLQDGVINEDLYERLRARYRDLLVAPPERAPAPAPPPPAPPAAPVPEGPGWLAEQQANLLLYLGAFLMVIAALVFVGYSGDTVSNGAKMALMAIGTLAFLGAGLVCHRIPRVEQAGIVFFAVGSLMVPLDFFGAYGFFFADEDIDPTGLWLGGSLASVLFYGAVAMLGMGRWYVVPAVAGMVSALGAVLVAVDAPPEAYPGSYIALAFVLALPSTVSLGRASEVFGPAGRLAANATVPLALGAALVMTQAAEPEGPEPLFELATRWYLPPTAALGALFYWIQALTSRDALRPGLTVVALAVTGGAAITLVFALDVGRQWYGPAVMIVGALYAAGSEQARAPSWPGRPYAGWMALGAITVSWVFFEDIYSDYSRHGAGVHFAATIFYLGAARLVQIEIPKAWQAQGWQEEGLYRALASGGFIYLAGLTLGIGYYQLLASLPAAETAEASDLSLAFLGPSLAIAAVASTMRWWWPEVRVHAYTVALGMSLFVLLSAAGAEGQVTLLLAVYTGVALALALWEGEALALPLSAAYGFFALLALWRYAEPPDEFLPLAVSATGYALFAAFLTLRALPGLLPRDRASMWQHVIEGLAFAYAVAAPVAGWVRLAILADDSGLVGADRFEETVLYQTAAASVLLLGVMTLAHGWLVAWRVESTAVASALLMVALLLEIGHFHPENPQAYTAPLGAYLVAVAFLALRAEGLPEDAAALIGPLETVGLVARSTRWPHSRRSTATQMVAACSPRPQGTQSSSTAPGRTTPAA